jgi:hypothetical protein
MNSIRTDDWSPWQPLLDNYLKAPEKPGAYFIARDRPINRLNDADPDGIIDIGESNNLYVRLSSFVGCARLTRKSGHMAGSRFGKYNFSKILPMDRLRVSWKVARDKPAAVRLEASLMNIYFSKHFELPPLNYKFNWESSK